MKIVTPKRTLLLLFILVLLILCLPIGFRFIRASSNIAFLGDSITQGWSYPRVNLGRYGNTTAQMMARFPTQVTGHHYKQVVILGGTNDVLLGIDPAVTVRNLQEMAEATIQTGAQPILCEIPPIFHSFNRANKTDYSQNVYALNQRIVQLAAGHKWTLIDYYDPIIGHPSYSSDGVHFKRRGYAVMEWTFFRERNLN